MKNLKQFNLPAIFPFCLAVVFNNTNGIGGKMQNKNELSKIIKKINDYNVIMICSDKKGGYLHIEKEALRYALLEKFAPENIIYEGVGIDFEKSVKEFLDKGFRLILYKDSGIYYAEKRYYS